MNKCIMLLQILLIPVLFFVLNYVSVKVTVNKLKGAESGKLGAGIAKILMGLFIFAVSGEDVVLRPEIWAYETSISYYLIRYGFLLMAVIGMIACLVAIYKRIEWLQTVMEDLRTREKDTSGKRW